MMAHSRITADGCLHTSSTPSPPLAARSLIDADAPHLKFIKTHDMSRLRLCLLGPPRIESDGVPLEFDTRTNVALLAYLAVTGGSHTREPDHAAVAWPGAQLFACRAADPTESL